MIAKLAIAASLLGCQRTTAPDLARELPTIDVASLQLDEEDWRRITVDPYRALHAHYVRELAAYAPSLAMHLRNSSGRIETRAHFADDPSLTLGQARTRWALPVMAPAQVVTISGEPIDAVFVFVRGGWRAIVGLDRVVTTLVGRLDPTCAARIDLPKPSHRCRSVAWQVADAALRNERERFAHACSLAASLCGTPTP